MKPLKKVVFYCTVLAVALACGLPAPAGPVTTPTAAPQATSPVDGIPFDISPLAGVLPFSMGTGVSYITTTEVEFPYVNGSFGDMPLHTKYLIDGYPLGDTLLSARVSIFSAAEYAA